MKKYLKSLPPKCLLDESVVMFVGSRSKNQKYKFSKASKSSAS